MAVNPFRIDVAQTVLDDLTERLAGTRWPAATALVLLHGWPG
jgi:hypothetical protein